jgi:O-antigen/teichoic acid export membrane protein
VDFGVFASGVAIGGFVGILACVGAPMLALKNEGGDHAGDQGAIILAIFAGATASVVTAMYLALSQQATILCIAATASYVFGEVLGNTTQNYFYGARRYALADAYLIARRAIPLTAIAISLVSGIEIFQAVLSGSVLVVLLSCFLAKPRLSALRIRETLSRGRPYWLASAASGAQQLDVLIVGAFMGQASAAIYAAAFRLASPVHIVTSSIVSIMVPKMMIEGDISQKSEISLPFVKLAFLYSTFLLLASPIFAHLVPPLLGSAYDGHTVVFAGLLAASAVSVLVQVQAARLYALGAQEVVWRITLGATLAGLALIALCASLVTLVACAFAAATAQILLFLALRSKVSVHCEE